jgi:catechol 2,3-dioxygenase-like lactoylglutathione lyase family enzyme
MRWRYLIHAMVAFVGPATGIAGAAEPDKSPELCVTAIRMAVVDYDESIRFYTEHLGCTVREDRRADGFVILDCDGVAIVLTEAARKADIEDGQAFVRVNFKTRDLDGRAAAMKEAGVKIIRDDRSAVGRYVVFEDPSGLRHNLKQLDDAAQNPEGTGIYDVGISVRDMTKARAFYERSLGFEVMTENYYPPVYPFKQRGAAFFILSDKDTKRPAPFVYGRTARTGLAFGTEDITAAMRSLKGEGVRFLDAEPLRTGPVLHAGFADPDGNIHEVIQHLESPDGGRAVSRAADITWLEGRWVMDMDGQSLEEIWTAPMGGTVIGMFRWERGSKAWLFEFMSIEEDEDAGLVFRLRHFHRKLVVWKSEADGPLTYPLARGSENELIFENPDRDQPRRFIYRRDGDRLTVSFEEPDGKGQSFKYSLAK